MVKRLVWALPFFALVAVGYFTVPLLGLQVPVPEHGRLMPTGAVAAAKFRWQQRLSEDGAVPENAFSRAMDQRSAMLAAQRRRPAMLANGVYPGGWTWMGPGNIGGRIRAILIDPTNPNTMWIGSASGGIWKTTNGGTSWFPLDDFMPTLAIGCMALDPTNASILYAGTGEGFFETIEGTSNTAAVRGAGIFKSTDGGGTWNQIPSTANPDWYFVNRLSISPANPQVLLAATNSGIYRSVNGGDSWTLTHAAMAYDVRFHPTDPLKAVAGLHDAGALVSVDGGQTWASATGLSGHRTELCYAPSNPAVVYAGVSDAGRIRIYRSTNGGASYALRSAGAGITTYEAYNSTIWVDPANADRVIFGGVYLYRSIDGGANQTQTYNGVHADMHAIVSHPGYNGTTNRTVFFGTDGGIYRTLDSTGSSATELNNNLGITQFYGAVVNPISGIAYAGAQDNGTMRYSGSTEGWTAAFGGDGGYCATDPTNANYFYGEVQWAYLFRSTNGGLSASYIFNGPNPIVGAGTTAFNFIPFFTLDPNDSNRMYMGGRLLWRSNNVKNSQVDWSSIKATIDPGGGGFVGGGDNGDAHFAENPPWNISTIAVAQGNSNLIFVGYNNGQIWKTVNGLNAQPTWTRVDDGGGPMPARWVSKIIIHPTNHDQVYASFMGWEPDNVWKTENGGANWAARTGAAPFKLPNVPVSALAVHPTQSGWLYAGSDIGLFFSADDGASWTTTNQGPGIVPIEELHWQGGTILHAVTHGRGLYRATLNLPSIAFSPDAIRVLSGIYVSGRLQEVYGSDNRYYRTMLPENSSRGVVEIDATAPLAGPSALRIIGEANADQGPTEASTVLNVFLLKPGEGFEFVKQFRVGGTDQTLTVSLTAAQAARYIDPATRRLRMQWIWSPGANVQKTLSIDQIVFEAEP